MSGRRVPPPQSRLFDTFSGVIDIMLGRTSGLSRIDLTTTGFWTSFAALALAGLFDASALSLLYDRSDPQNAAANGKLFYIVGHLAITLIAYGASLITLYLLCRAPGEQVRVAIAVTVHNWAAPVVSIAFFPLLIAANIFGEAPVKEPNSLLNMISIFWIGILIFAGLRLMRISLNIPVGRAALYFAVTTGVSIVCTEGLEQLIGLKAVA